jgi:hypothetical protein
MRVDALAGSRCGPTHPDLTGRAEPAGGGGSTEHVAVDKPLMTLNKAGESIHIAVSCRYVILQFAITG